MTVLTARGVPSESQISFSGLLELLRPLLGQLPELPPPQAAALAGALALGPPTGGDRFAVYAATLSLLARARAGTAGAGDRRRRALARSRVGRGACGSRRGVSATSRSGALRAAHGPRFDTVRACPCCASAGSGATPSLALLPAGVGAGVAERSCGATARQPAGAGRDPGAADAGPAGRPRAARRPAARRRARRARVPEPRSTTLPAAARSALLRRRGQRLARPSTRCARRWRRSGSTRARSRPRSRPGSSTSTARARVPPSARALDRLPRRAGAASGAPRTARWRVRSRTIATSTRPCGAPGISRPRRSGPTRMSPSSSTPPRGTRATARATPRRRPPSSAPPSSRPTGDDRARRSLRAAEAWQLAGRSRPRGRRCWSAALPGDRRTRCCARRLHHLSGRIDIWRGPATAAKDRLVGEAARIEPIAPELAARMLTDAVTGSSSPARSRRP